ncbi:MAG TPA: isoprenyl transferase [Clostridiaceae bacterium]
MFHLSRKKSLNVERDIDLENIPSHIAIIMDGNGRWAKAKKLPRSFGHKAGVEAIRNVVKECNNLGVKYLTLYAFSTENWVRPAEEVNTLMKLLIEYLKNELKELDESGVVINSLGDISKLPLLCQEELRKAQDKTKLNTKLNLNLALNYGGRDDILRAMKKIGNDLLNHNIKLKDLSESLITGYLDTKGIPDPDIIIRPSGEQRLSNFLLWQAAYSELWFSDIYWPDFNKKVLHKAIYDYQNRERRYGGIK